MSVETLLATINKSLDGIGAPATEMMTHEQFITYAKDQVEKAKADKDKELAKKRLLALKAQTEAIMKMNWESTGQTPVTIFKDPGQQETTETTVQTPPPGNVGTQGDSYTFASGDGAQTFAKALENLIGTIDADVVAATPRDPNADFWPRDLNDPSFMKDGIKKRTQDEAADWGPDPWAKTK